MNPSTAIPESPQRSARWRLFAAFRRGLLILVVLAQVLAGTYYMIAILPYHGGTWVEKGMAALFALLFSWISIGFWTAVYGFVLRRLGGDCLSLVKRHRKTDWDAIALARTAVVMPIYHEPIERTLGGLRAIYRSLERTGRLDDFDFFILSDSRDPEVWLAEQSAWYQLCQELNAEERLFYRRRTVNLNYKSGNIADFLRRWGKCYEYMIVLDADSLMEGDTLVRMVQLMQLEPQVGILQTAPTLVNARSLFARVQQFANHLYGPLFSTGLAAIQLGDAAYWGHNAVIRTAPFMRHCGLPQLPGLGLFKGPIMSHDFVEAAFMGRAGFEVWMEPELTHSFEESPPTLVDELTRDKRWAKGNLQHLWLMLFSRKLRFAHRMAFLNGIMSYLASPLWLAFLVLTTIETTRLTLWPINYFPSAHSLFPLWPEWHPEWAIRLAGSTVVLLFLPKILAILDVLLTHRRRDHGGFIRLTLSVALEILISTLLAPIRMLAHSRYVLGALFNVSLHWGGQNRTDETGWKAAFISQAPGTVVAAAWAGFAWWLKPMFFFWSLPVALPLVLAAPTSVLLSRVGVGQWLRRRKLMLTPEEILGSQLLEDLAGGRLLTSLHRGLIAFEEAIIDPRLNAVHVALARPPRHDVRRERFRQLREHCLRDGPKGLSRRELTLLAKDGESLVWLHNAVWRAAPDTYWGQLLERRITRIETD
ncbi:glucans biosynthesis glucosyltransferase MdoH [Mangrovitalea sediminis]|uniref:glucans biosynthesis glucosyltransferase MdoH n=1 Tax=Mangrovitalea sediminis TaxID=1982043 RepID=UPI000BE5FD65|nr:glucans biosynthesis glucosyltransferase MdoH [Mangrovitalea sediminis]